MNRLMFQNRLRGTIRAAVFCWRSLWSRVVSTFTTQGKQPKVHVWLIVLLHNNDGEFQLIDAGSGLEDFGGAARFATLMNDLNSEAMHPPRSQAVQEGEKKNCPDRLLRRQLSGRT